jgi:hypothetical protein
MITAPTYGTSHTEGQKNGHRQAPVMRFERIEACPKCDKRYHVIIEDALVDERSVQEVHCDCGEVLVRQLCFSIMLEPVQAP